LLPPVVAGRLPVDVYTVGYTVGMGVPEVLSIRELRGQLAAVVDGVRSGGPVFAGSHRKPEVVVMSVSQYEELTGQAQDVERVVRSLAASMEMEGMALSATELGEVRLLAAGRIDFAEYRRRVGV